MSRRIPPGASGGASGGGSRSSGENTVMGGTEGDRHGLGGRPAAFAGGFGEPGTGGLGGGRPAAYAGGFSEPFPGMFSQGLARAAGGSASVAGGVGGFGGGRPAAYAGGFGEPGTGMFSQGLAHAAGGSASVAGGVGGFGGGLARAGGGVGTSGNTNMTRGSAVSGWGGLASLRAPPPSQVASPGALPMRTGAAASGALLGLSGGARAIPYVAPGFGVEAAPVTAFSALSGAAAAAAAPVTAFSALSGAAAAAAAPAVGAGFSIDPPPPAPGTPVDTVRFFLDLNQALVIYGLPPGGRAYDYFLSDGEVVDVRTLTLVQELTREQANAVKKMITSTVRSSELQIIEAKPFLFQLTSTRTPALKISYTLEDIDTLLNSELANIPNFAGRYTTIGPGVRPTSATKPTAIESTERFFRAPGPIRDIFIVTDFLRSYIDIHHDILDSAPDVVRALVDDFTANVYPGLSPKARGLYDRWSNVDTRIRTSGRLAAVSQPKCRQALEELVDTFHSMIAIPWIPLTRAEAVIGTFTINNPADMLKLATILTDNGVRNFFIESAASSIGSKLEDNGLRPIALDVDAWDAGSGYTGRHGPERRIGPSDLRLPEAFAPLPAPPIDMFGTITFTVSPDNGTLTISGIHDIPGIAGANRREITLPRQRLSVNNVLVTIGRSAIRGEAAGAVLAGIQPAGLPPSMEAYKRIASGKPWTDWVQLRTQSLAKEITVHPAGSARNIPFKTLTIASDICCEISARLIALGLVGRNDGGVLTLLCYDTNVRAISPELLELKADILGRVRTHAANLYISVIKTWFNRRINTLHALKEGSLDPAMYFTCALFESRYASQHAKARTELIRIRDAAGAELANMVPRFPTSLEDWFKSITNCHGLAGEFTAQLEAFRAAQRDIGGLAPRSPLEDFKKAYDTLSREITNAYGDQIADARVLRIYTAAVFATIMLTDRAPRRYFDTLQSLKQQVLGIAGRSIVPGTVIDPALALVRRDARGMPVMDDFARVKALSAATPDLQQLTDIEFMLAALLVSDAKWLNTYQYYLGGGLPMPLALGQGVDAAGGDFIDGVSFDALLAQFLPPAGYYSGGARRRHRRRRTRRRGSRAAARRAHTFRRRK